MNAESVVWRWRDVDASMSGEDLSLVHRYADARVWVRDGRLVRGPGYEEASPAARREVARVGAIVRLRQRGRYFVHAAGAVDPRGRAWLLAGDSGSGKSTLAYALARSGWTILGDDGVLISLAGRDVTAHAWYAPLEVSSALAAAFPELGAHVSRARAGDPRRRIPIDVPLAREAPVAALLFVEQAEPHTITPLGPLAALAALVRQSPWVIIDDAYASSHLDALRRAAALPTFRLAHTPAELHAMARILTEALP
jgi:hypothetical protein